MGQGPQERLLAAGFLLDPVAHEEGGLPANAQSPHSTQHSTFLSKYLESETKMRRTSAELCPGWKSLDLFPEICGPPHSHVSAVTQQSDLSEQLPFPI